eukprot:6717424-Prymnesium_polylepis.2
MRSMRGAAEPSVLTRPCEGVPSMRSARHERSSSYSRRGARRPRIACSAAGRGATLHGAPGTRSR